MNGEPMVPLEETVFIDANEYDTLKAENEKLKETIHAMRNVIVRVGYWMDRNRESKVADGAQQLRMLCRKYGVLL